MIESKSSFKLRNCSESDVKFATSNCFVRKQQYCASSYVGTSYTIYPNNQNRSKKPE